MGVRAGALDREITIEKKVVTQDPTYGTELITWYPLARDGLGSPIIAIRFPANVQDVMPSRDERLVQGAAIATQRTRVRIRYRDDVDSSMRITVHGDVDTVYQIVGGPSMVGGRKEYIEFMAERYSS